MGPFGEFKCFAQRAVWNDSIDIFIGYRQQDGSTDAIVLPTLRRIGPGDVAEPLLRLQIEAAQRLMDELWNAGLRPTEGTGSAGAMAAVQAHLGDMRRLVFDGKPGAK